MYMWILRRERMKVQGWEGGIAQMYILRNKINQNFIMYTDYYNIPLKHACKYILHGEQTTLNHTHTHTIWSTYTHTYYTTYTQIKT